MAKYSTLVSNEFSSDDEPDVHDGKIKYPNLETLGDLSANSLDISDEQLLELLKKYGISHGPLVETTRNLYKRLLAREIKHDATLRAAQAVTGQNARRNAQGELPQPIVSISSSGNGASAQPTSLINNNNNSSSQQQKKQVNNLSKTVTPSIVPGASRYAKSNLAVTKTTADIYSSDEDDINMAVEPPARPHLTTKGKQQQQQLASKQKQAAQPPATRSLINLGKRPLAAAKKKDVTDSIASRYSRKVSDDYVEDDNDEDDDDFDVDQLTDDDSDNDDSGDDTDNDTEEDDQLTEEDTKEPRSAELIARNSGAQSALNSRAGRRYMYALLAFLAVIVAYFIVSMLE